MTNVPSIRSSAGRSSVRPMTTYGWYQQQNRQVKAVQLLQMVDDPKILCS